MEYLIEHYGKNVKRHMRESAIYQDGFKDKDDNDLQVGFTYSYWSKEMAEKDKGMEYRNIWRTDWVSVYKISFSLTPKTSWRNYDAQPKQPAG
jgi:hypothetical protein